MLRVSNVYVLWGKARLSREINSKNPQNRLIQCQASLSRTEGGINPFRVWRSAETRLPCRDKLPTICYQDYGKQIRSEFKANQRIILIEVPNRFT